MAFNIIEEVTPGELQKGNMDQYVTGPLSELDYNAPGFEYDFYKYPLIQNPDYPSKGHNIVFYINAPNGSEWDTSIPGVSPEPFSNKNTDPTRFGERNGPINGNFIGDGARGLINGVLGRKSSRTTAAISLYIPNAVYFNQTARYSEVSLSEALGVVGDVASFVSSIFSGQGKAAVGAASAMIPGVSGLANHFQKTPGPGERASSFSKHSSLLTGAAASVRPAVLSYLGIADNPQNFLLFKQMDFRKFQFEFFLVPESEKEASVIRHIIRLFRMHQTPEVIQGSLGRFFIPPSDFDIDIVMDGKRNPNIPRFGTCVLESITVDYAESGVWGTTTDGMPLQVKLLMDFKEVEVLTKDRIESGY